MLRFHSLRDSHYTIDSGFSASPLVEGERTEVRDSGRTDRLRWAKPDLPPLPPEGEATHAHAKVVLTLPN